MTQTYTWKVGEEPPVLPHTPHNVLDEESIH